MLTLKMSLVAMMSFAGIIFGACAPIQYVRGADPVGPAPLGAPDTPSAKAHGQLIVETMTESVDVGDDTYYPHTSYSIHDLQGRLLRKVPNRDDREDPDPTVVKLAPGTYLVRAQSNRLEVTVRIEAGQATRVYLDGSWTPPDQTPKNIIARASDGSPIGWHARSGSALGTEGELRYEGSSTVASFVRDAQSVFTKASISIDDRGESDVGEVAVLGTADLGGVARKIMRPTDNVECKVIGYDAIVAIVRADSPVKGLTRQQLSGVFSGRIANWLELGGPDNLIKPLIVAQGSATRAVFKSTIMEGEPYDALVVTPDRDIIKRVARSGSMIGQVSMALIQSDDGVQVLAIDGQLPTEDNRNYPIVRPLNMCVRKNGPKLAQAFVEWSLSNDGQAVVRRRFLGVGEHD